MTRTSLSACARQLLVALTRDCEEERRSARRRRNSAASGGTPFEYSEVCVSFVSELKEGCLMRIDVLSLIERRVWLLLQLSTRRSHSVHAVLRQRPRNDVGWVGGRPVLDVQQAVQVPKATLRPAGTCSRRSGRTCSDHERRPHEDVRRVLHAAVHEERKARRERRSTTGISVRSWQSNLMPSDRRLRRALRSSWTAA